MTENNTETQLAQDKENVSFNEEISHNSDAGSQEQTSFSNEEILEEIVQSLMDLEERINLLEQKQGSDDSVDENDVLASSGKKISESLMNLAAFIKSQQETSMKERTDIETKHTKEMKGIKDSLKSIIES